MVLDSWERSGQLAGTVSVTFRSFPRISTTSRLLFLLVPRMGVPDASSIAVDRKGIWMNKYLIEVPHDSDKVACARAIQVFHTTGSHFVANADWGCDDGEHKAWIIVEVASREDARSILPPAYRSEAKIVKLTKFTLQEAEDIIRQHEG